MSRSAARIGANASISARTFGSNEIFAPTRAASITPRLTAAIALSLVSDEPITWK